MNKEKLIKILIITACLFALLIILIFTLKSIIAPLSVAWLIAYIFDPIIDKFQKVIKSRSFCIMLLLIFLAIIFIAFILIIIPTASEQAQKIINKLPNYQKQLENYFKIIFSKIQARYPESFNLIWQKSLSIIQQQAPRLLEPIIRFLYYMFSGLVNFILGFLNIIIIPIVSYYLLKDFDKINKKIIDLVPIKYQGSFIEIMKEIDDVLGSFLRGQLIVSLILGIIYILGLSILQVPMAFTIGLIGGLANMVPYLGLVVGLLPSIVLSAIEHQSLSKILWIIAVFAFAQILEGTIISPRLIGGKVKLHPVIVILAIMVGGSLLGFVGLIISIPACAIFMVILRKIISKYKASRYWRNGGMG